MMSSCERIVFRCAAILLVFFVAVAVEETAALGIKAKPSASTTGPTTATRATKSYVELFEPKSNTEVVLLGCLHGSLSSSMDVKQLLLGETKHAGDDDTAPQQAAASLESPQKDEEEPKPSSSSSSSFPDAVVLELCEPRYRGLLESRGEVVEDYDNEEFWKDLASYWKRTFRNNPNPLVALVKVVLGTTSIFQTNLSGIRAGLEFEVAIEMVEAENNKKKKDGETEEVLLVMGDRDIDETMDRIGSLPLVSMEMVRGNDDDKETFFSGSIPEESDRLKASVFGDPSLPRGSQICMPEVLVRSPQARRDLGRLLLLPSVVGTLSALVAAWIARGLEPDPHDVLLWDALFSSSSGEPPIEALAAVAGDSFWDFFALLAGYVLVALPAARVIVSERDDVLAESILETVLLFNARRQRLSLLQQQEREGSSFSIGRLPQRRRSIAQPRPKRKRIVAVLGLLHVNGVAKQLLDCGFVGTTPTTRDNGSNNPP